MNPIRITINAGKLYKGFGWLIAVSPRGYVVQTDSGMFLHLPGSEIHAGEVEVDFK